MTYSNLVRRGYIPTPQHLRGIFVKWAHRFGVVPTPPPRDLRAFTCKVLDQGNSGSCVGHGTAAGLYIAANVAGKPFGFIPSPYRIYQNALAYDRGDPANGPLTDQGCMPSSAMLGLTNFGLSAMQPQSAETDVPQPPPGQNTQNFPDPDLSSIEIEGQHFYVGWYAVKNADEARAAIGAGAPVGIGTYVDTRFERWTPSEPPLGLMDTSDPQGGGHFTALTTTTANGTFWGQNSWNTGYGASGFYECNDDFVNQAGETGELIAFGWKGMP